MLQCYEPIKCFFPETLKNTAERASGLEYLQAAVLTYQDMWKAPSFSELPGKNSWCTNGEEAMNLGCWEVRKEQTTHVLLWGEMEGWDSNTEGVTVLLFLLSPTADHQGVEEKFIKQSPEIPC